MRATMNIEIGKRKKSLFIMFDLNLVLGDTMIIFVQ